MKYKIISILILGLFFVTSCDKGFEELNTNPNDPVEIPSDLLLADVVRVTGNVMYWSFTNDMGANWSQQWAKVQYNNEARYEPRGSVIESIWNSMYEGVISDSRSMYDLAGVEGNKAVQGVALITQAYAFSVLTDLFGMVPFTDAIGGVTGNFKPGYDSQAAVYQGIIGMLTDADVLLKSGEGSINGSADLLYAGNASAWAKYANSLKFRCLMRISGKEDVSAELQALMNGGNMFSSNADEAKLIYLGSVPNANPTFENIVEGGREEYRVNSVLVDMLADDPRLPVYAQENPAGDYYGKPSGIFDVPNDDYNYENVSWIGSLYLEATAPAYFVSYAELMLLQAEAAQRNLITGSAASFYEAGITASLEANGVGSGAADFLPTVAFTDANAMEKIGEQKWIALFCQGVEAWTEYRRTGFPVLSPAIDGAIDEIPSRLTYPGTEQSVNQDNYNAAVGTQGADALTTKVWWMN